MSRVAIFLIATLFCQWSHADCQLTPKHQTELSGKLAAEHNTAMEVAPKITRVGAVYQISVQTEKNKTEKPTDKLIFWRDNQQVMYEYQNRMISESWNLLTNGRVRLVKYFDEYQQGIEYQPSEVKTIIGGWQSKYQMISSELLASMQAQSGGGDNCENITLYKTPKNVLAKADSNYQRQSLEVEWLNIYQLPRQIKTKSNGVEQHWQLVELIDDPLRVQQAFKLKQNYQLTDYADIGDNESDPFLRKMINLGFVEHGASGIYDIQGNILEQQPLKTETVKHHH